VIRWVRARGAGGRAVFVMFDEQTEELAAAAGLRVAHPPAELRRRLDSKIVTTRLGNEAGVPSVPNVLGRAAGYRELTELAARSGLGDDLVVQMPYGDSGKTTFFITCQADWDACAAKEPLASSELKVMRRIDHRAVAVEAVLTRHGTLVGPLMNDITGHPELTPYRGGWAGNDYPATLTAGQKRRARELTGRLGDRLAAEGYVGFFEVDYLVDTGTGDLYLGELNPRISGISSMTNVTAGAYADMPLFLFHLLEYLDVDYEVDIGEINERWSREAAVDVWSQIIIKETAGGVELLTAAPRTGIYRLADDGTVTFARPERDWHGIDSEAEAFYLRIEGPGDYRYRGADLGALVTRGRLQTDDNRLEDRCKQWITGIRAQFAGAPLASPQAAPVSPTSFKMA
jgi:biotin carboxylase